METKPLRVLFTSPGRRFELIKLFKESFPEGSSFYGADFDETSPASYNLDKVFRVPYQIDEKYIEKILTISIENNVDLIIPLIDPELLLFAEYKAEFEANGIFVMISDFDTIQIAADKWFTSQFLKENNIPAPFTCLPSHVEALDQITYPVIAKPRKGSASKGIYKIDTREEFDSISIDDSYIVQEMIMGDEVTVDIFCDDSRKCYQAVQRKRMKIRGGEVERGVTIKNDKIFQGVRTFISKYRPVGVVNIQFLLRDGEPYFIEINPRFGGGYPLAHAAGVNYPGMLLDLYQGRASEVVFGDYSENMYMFRYDRAIYTNELIELC